MKNINNTSISIVICTYNGSERIEKVLSCFKDQVQCEEVEWEIIVVDNNSTDNTYETVQNLSSEFGDRLKLVQETKQGLIHARIKGYHASKYNVISYIDDDNYVANDWIARVYKVMNTYPDVGACGGYNTLYVDKNTTIPEWFENRQEMYAVGAQSSSTSGYVEHLWGSGLSIRNEILDVLFLDKYTLLLQGRTGEGLASGEDSEIVYAARLLNWKLFYDDRIQLQHHLSPNRFSIQYLEKIYHAFGVCQVYLVPYSSYLQNDSTLYNTVKYSQIWQLVYLVNQLKIILYSLLYAIHSFSPKKENYKLTLTFIKASNQELYRIRKRYKNIFIHIKKLFSLRKR